MIKYYQNVFKRSNEVTCDEQSRENESAGHKSALKQESYNGRNRKPMERRSFLICKLVCIISFQV